MKVSNYSYLCLQDRRQDPALRRDRTHAVGATALVYPRPWATTD